MNFDIDWDKVESIDDLKRINGVKRVAPIVFASVTGVGDIAGVDPEFIDIFSGGIELDEGREYEIGENEVIAGYLYAKRNRINPGDTIEIRGNDFEVVAIQGLCRGRSLRHWE